MKTLEQRIKALEEMMAEIHNIPVISQALPPPDAEKYKHAVEAAVDGDWMPLKLYLKRGGQVYKAETIYPDAAVQRGGSNASSRYRPRAGGRDGGRRSANLPTAATIPSSSPGP